VAPTGDQHLSGEPFLDRMRPISKRFADYPYSTGAAPTKLSAMTSSECRIDRH
jgi:hypothetical protein